MSDLDRQVAKALGWETRLPFFYEKVKGIKIPQIVEPERPASFSPTTNWEQCGKLIEEYKITVKPVEIISDFDHADLWQAISDGVDAIGETPQEAVCRALIASMENKG